MPKYAINISDWSEFLTNKPTSPESLLLRPLISHETVKCENTLDGDAWIVNQEITAERWEAIVSLLRKHHHRNNFRLYQSKTGKGGWKRVK